MRILLTGHDGYIGAAMSRMLVEAGHHVEGLDTGLFADCVFGSREPEIAGRRIDLRDVETQHLEGFDAVVHLAALCNDPLGNMNPSLTFDINHHASLRLATLAKAAGVTRFVFASSCSLYGVAGDELLQEDAAFNPITPYGVTKVRLEQDLARLADDAFSPTYMRNATAYGVSPRLRADVVLNNLVLAAYTTGEVLLQSDGTPWRPIVHVRDFSRAFITVLEAPRSLVHDQAFNVGRTSENYRVSELAEIVASVVPGSRVRYTEGGGPDPRSYRVDCSKLEGLSGYTPQWTAKLGAEELLAACEKNKITSKDFEGDRYFRIRHILKLQDRGELDHEMRWLRTPINSVVT